MSLNPYEIIQYITAFILIIIMIAIIIGEIGIIRKTGTGIRNSVIILTLFIINLLAGVAQGKSIHFLAYSVLILIIMYILVSYYKNKQPLIKPIEKPAEG